MKTRQKIEVVFKKHFPHKKQNVVDMGVMSLYQNARFSFPHVYREKEVRKALQKISELQTALASLPPFARVELQMRMGFVHHCTETTVGEHILKNKYNESNFETFVDLAEVASEAAAKLLTALPTATEPGGKRNWAHVRCVDAAAKAWQLLGGTVPDHPTSPGSAFENFIADIFQALGEKANARSAYKSWREVYSKTSKGR